ncbi:MAG: hypothetical protein ABSE99_15815 [Terracidiphilus sp.]|jgi:hypothetical protein
MSLLHQDSPEEIDDAALGESFTKGSSHVVWASVIAAVLVTIAIAAYVIAGQKPPVATGEIVGVWAHPIHNETSGVDANGVPMPKETFDQVLVFARVKVHNQSDHPLFLHQVMTNATVDDGIHSSYAAIPADYERVFHAYPELAPLHGKALSPETAIDPGQTLEGDVVSAFRLTKQEWDARKDLNFTFALRYNPNLVLAPHAAVIEQ